MSTDQPVLHLICGKIAAGKSTLSSQLGSRDRTIIIREDFWLARLFPDEQKTLADYVRNSQRLRSAMAAHICDLLRAGISVVLDFPANTPVSRAWMRTLFEDAGAAHQLHFLDAPDDVCKARLHKRNSEGGHEFTVNDADFDLFTRHFVPPAADEGFNIIHYRI
jgi:predicted kinase